MSAGTPLPPRRPSVVEVDEDWFSAPASAPAPSPAPAAPTAKIVPVDDDWFAAPAAPLATPSVPQAPAPTGPSWIERADAAIAPVNRNIEEVGKGIVPGAIQMGGSIVKGGAATFKLGEHNARDFGLQKTTIDRIDQGLPVADTEDPLGYQHMDPAQRAEVKRQLADAEAQQAPIAPLKENPVYQAGQAVEDFGKTVMPATPGYEQSPGRIVGEGLGSMAAGAVLSAVGGPVVAGAGFTLSGIGEGVDRAIEAGATEDQILETVKYGGMSGATDLVPVEMLLGRIPIPGIGRIKVPPGMLGKAIKYIAGIGAQAFVEGSQEAVQTLIQNYGAQQVYNPDQDLMEGLPGDAKAGAGVGAIAEAFMGMLPGRQHHGPRSRLNDVNTAPIDVGGSAVPPGALPADPIIGPDPGAGPIPASDVAALEQLMRTGQTPGASTTLTVNGQVAGQAQGPAPAPVPASDATVPAPLPGVAEQPSQVSQPSQDAPAQLTPDQAGSQLAALLNGVGAAQAAPAPAAPPMDLKALLDDPRPLAEIQAEQAAKEEAVRVAKAQEAEAVRLADIKAASPALVHAIQQETLAKPLPNTDVAGYEGMSKAEDVKAAVRQHVETAEALAEQGVHAENQAAFEATLRSIERGRNRLEQIAGTKEAPVQLADNTVHVGAEQTAIPTPAQAEAGNYQKRHLQWKGYDLAVETEAGQERTGVAPDGTPWSTTMPAPYGYLKGTKGADGDHLDVYIASSPDTARSVFIVDQVDPDTGAFDEHKIIIGARNEQEARSVYEGGFSDGSGARRMGAISAMPVAQFKAWSKDRKATKKPVAYKPTREKKPFTKEPKKLLEHFAFRGGIAPDEEQKAFRGELAARDLHRTIVRGVGWGKLVKKGGMQLDKARELAVDLGYLPSHGSVDDLLNLIEREAFHKGDAQTQVQERDSFAAPEEQDPAEYEKEVSDALIDDLVSLGLSKSDIDPATLDRAVQIVMAGEPSLEIAWEKAVVEMGRDVPQVAAVLEAEHIPFDEEEYDGPREADWTPTDEDWRSLSEGSEPGDGYEQGPFGESGQDGEGFGGSEAAAASDRSDPASEQASGSVGDFDFDAAFDAGQDEADQAKAPKPLIRDEPRGPASWVIRNKATGEVVMETFDRAKVDALNTDKYEAVPIQEYLGSINGQAPAAGKPDDQNGQGGGEESGPAASQQATSETDLLGNPVPRKNKEKPAPAQSGFDLEDTRTTAERIRQEQAKKGRATEEQADTDGLSLFNDDAKQTDLVEEAAKPATLSHETEADAFANKALKERDREIKALRKNADKARAAGQEERAQFYEGQIRFYERVDAEAFRADVRANLDYYTRTDIDPFLRYDNREMNRAPRPETPGQKAKAIREKRAKKEKAPDADPLKAEAAKVTRNFQRYTSGQRANHAASHRLKPGQKESTGEYFYTHPAVAGVAFPTRGAAARAGLKANSQATTEAKAPDAFDAAFDAGQDDADQAQSPREAILKTQYTGNAPWTGPDGRSWRIKKASTLSEGSREAGYVAMRMPPKQEPGKAPSGELPTYFRGEKGQEWGPEQAASEVMGRSGVFGGQAPATRTKAEVAKSAAKNAGQAADAAGKALSTLFNSKGRPGSGFTFDEETYAQAKPLFQQFAVKFRAAAADLNELVRLMVKDMRENLGLTREGMEASRPYMRRFMEDVKAGNIVLEETTNAPGDAGNLERDSGNTAPRDELGGGDVQPSGGRAGRRSGQRSGQAGAKASDQSGARGGVSESGSAPVGAKSDSEVRPDAPTGASSSAERGDSGRGGPGGEQGFLPNDPGIDQAARNASNAADLKARQDAQTKAETIPVKPGLENVRATLPMLLPAQQEDVHKAEQSFDKRTGMLFTNGTGTGKTFSGLGVVKRFARQGKTSILIVAPSQGILEDWVTSAKTLGLDVKVLENTKSKGQGIVATTYENLGKNQHLADRDWDLVVADEAQKLAASQEGTPSKALDTLRAITNHPRGLYTKADHHLRDKLAKQKALHDQGKKAEAALLAAELLGERNALVEKFRGQPRSKVTFLSATPWAYDQTVDYAEGYLFDYPPETSGGYNHASGKDAFFVQHFGYRMRTGRLTKPDAGVNTEVLERQFHEYLKREGALSGRVLDVEADYQRHFVLVEDSVGTKIDQALEWLSEAGDKFRPLNDLLSSQFDYLTRMRLLEAIKAHHAVETIRKDLELGRKVVVFHDYNEGGGFDPFLMPGRNDTPYEWQSYESGKGTTVHKTTLGPIWAEFVKANPYIESLNFSAMQAPIATLKEAFPNALIYNGKVPNKERSKAKALFNQDGSGYDLIVVQSAAGEAGISLHDTTGQHQRALHNLGMPVRPTTAIQEEGRIYRTGQVSDAIFRYYNTGTNWEQWTFASKIATRSSTAENLALGEQARALRTSFIDAFNEAVEVEPKAGEGRGGKARDRREGGGISEWEKAKTLYRAQQKVSGRRDQREGNDYYATPEPIGLKMVQLGGIQFNERVLEPSAGHGAIARFFPEGANRTLIEPSTTLLGRAALNSPGAKTVQDRFENHHVTNKYDVIVMNPPYGVGGKLAAEHVAKAVTHLRNGGRIVALVPTGSAAEARFEALNEDPVTKDVYQIATIRLPRVTFERAGTQQPTAIVVWEKQTDAANVAKLPTIQRDYSGEETVNGLFDRIEHLELPPRLEPLTKDAEPLPDTGEVEAGGFTFELKTVDGSFVLVGKKKALPWETWKKLTPRAKSAGATPNWKTRELYFATPEARAGFITGLGERPLENEPAAAPASAGSLTADSFNTATAYNDRFGRNQYVASFKERVERDVYANTLDRAKLHGGWYSAFAGGKAVAGFQFKTEAARQAFLDSFNLANGTEFSTAPAGWGEVEPEAGPTLSDKAIKQIAEIIGRVSGLKSFKLKDRIFIRGPGAEAWGSAEGGEAAGAYTVSLEDAAHDLVTMSRSIWDELGVRTAFHESFHRLQTWFLTDQERAILKGAEAKLRSIVAANEGRKNQAAKMSRREIEAESFALYMTKPTATGFTAQVKNVFAKIGRLLRALDNWRKGQGFQTWEDVFERAASGEIARRAPRATPITNRTPDFAEAPASIASPAFKRWFGKSKVVDASGKPLVVYHGAPDGRFMREEGVFKSLSDRYGENKGVGVFWFAKDRATAVSYADDRRAFDYQNAEPEVISAYLKLENPLIVEGGGKEWREAQARGKTTDVIEMAQAAGHDGVIIRNVRDNYNNGPRTKATDTYVVFDSRQIKSVTNRGTFDANDPRVEFSTVPPAGPAPDASQGFLAKGQFIDRTLRVGMGFDLFGGIDSDGRWNPGKNLFEGATRVLTESKPDPNGRFGWTASILENARRNLIDRYGLDDEYKRRDRRTQLDKQAILAEGKEILDKLMASNVGPAEAKVLQAILTGEPVNDADMQALAEPIRESIDQLGEEAVALGLISRESYERNKGSYLHRVYQKNEEDANALGRWTSRVMDKRRKRIIGDQLKGRGIFLDVKLDRLMAGNEAWAKARQGKPFKGERFIMFEYTPGAQLNTAGGSTAKATRREYHPAGEPIPAKFTGPGWSNKGEWEVRKDSAKGDVTLWRDYSKDERSRMGEILDARYNIAKTYMLMANDLSTGRFFKDVAENEAWSSTTEPAAPWKEAGDYNRFWNDPNIMWVRVPDTVIANTGGKKRWGALSGKWVQAEIWKDLNELNVQMRPTTWRRMLTQWKLNKTARNPVVHVNNIVSNLMFMDLADVRVQDLVAGIRSYYEKDEHYRNAVRHGAMGADQMSQEIRDKVLKPILDELQGVSSGGANPLLARFGAVGRLADLLWSGAKAFDSKMVNAYQLEDEIFRMATYRRRLALGNSEEQAADIARELFIDYDIRAPLVNAARNSVLPFISYVYRAAPLLARAMAERPWKLAKYYALAYAAQALIYAWDDDDDEDKEQAALRKEEQGRNWLGVPRMMRMPIDDEKGQPTFLDIRRWVPAGDVFDLAQGSGGAIPIPASLMPGGPAMLAGEIIFNKVMFTGKPITNPLIDTAGDKAAKVADYLWKAWMPTAPWIPNSWYQEKIINAATGAKDRNGEAYSLRDALLSSFGIKFRPLDVEQGLMFRRREFQTIERNLKDAMRDNARQRAQNLISQSAFEKQQAAILEKFKRLGEEQRKFNAIVK